MTQTIRRADVADADAISKLRVAAWQRAYRGILPDAVLDGLDPAKNAARRRARMASPVSPDRRDWLLEEDGRLVGWAATGPPRDPGLKEATHELYAIYLDPDAVGQGYGRALMTHCVADCTQRGYREMVMWVLAGNERAQRFYAAAGFANDERVPPEEFQDTGATKLRMVRSLMSA